MKFGEMRANTFDPVRDIQEFHIKYELAYAGAPRELPEEVAKFRVKFLAEELCEYTTDLGPGDREDIQYLLARNHAPGNLHLKLDALVDLVYVALGTSYLHGFDFREAWRRVHAANMTKVRALRAGDSTRGSIYDVVKPQGFVPPDLSDLVR